MKVTKKIYRRRKKRYGKFSKKLKRFIKRVARNAGELKFWQQPHDHLITANTSTQSYVQPLLGNFERGIQQNEIIGDECLLKNLIIRVLLATVIQNGSTLVQQESLLYMKYFIFTPKKNVDIGEVDQYLGNNPIDARPNAVIPNALLEYVNILKRREKTIYWRARGAPSAGATGIYYEHFEGPMLQQFKWRFKTNKKLKFSTRDTAPLDPINTQYWFYLCLTAPANPSFVTSINLQVYCSYKDP